MYLGHLDNKGLESGEVFLRIKGSFQEKLLLPHEIITSIHLLLNPHLIASTEDDNFSINRAPTRQ